MFTLLVFHVKFDSKGKRAEKGPEGGVVEKSLRAVVRLGAVEFGLGASGKVRGLQWQRAGGAGEAM